MMKQAIIILFVICSFSSVHAQIGLSAQYNTIKHDVWTDIFESSNNYRFEDAFTLPNTVGFGVDYWLHPFQYRIEFFPTLAYAKHSAVEPKINNPFSGFGDKFELSLIELSIPTRIYPLDIEGECDCPTWGKDGSLIKKGFYISGIIGLTLTNANIQLIEPINIDASEVFETENTSTIFHAGVGTGLDIGLNKYITLTPFVNYKIHFNANWNDLQNVVSANGVFFEDTNSNINQLQFGLRLGFQLKD